jgi:hypothetical protein
MEVADQEWSAMTTDEDPTPGRDALRAAGFDLASLDGAQLEVLDSLTDDEVAVLVEVQRRLLETDPEVVAHNVSPLTIGGLFF